MKRINRLIALISALVLVLSLCVTAFAEEASTLSNVSNYVMIPDEYYCESCDEIRSVMFGYYLMADGTHRFEYECQTCWQVFSSDHSSHMEGGFVQICQGCFDLYGPMYQFYCEPCDAFTAYDKHVVESAVNYFHPVVINCDTCGNQIVSMEKSCTSDGTCGSCADCVALGDLGSKHYVTSRRYEGEHGAHKYVSYCGACKIAYYSESVTYSPNCSVCNDPHGDNACTNNGMCGSCSVCVSQGNLPANHTVGALRIEGEHGSHYAISKCINCNYVSNRYNVSYREDCLTCNPSYATHGGEPCTSDGTCGSCAICVELGTLSAEHIEGVKTVVGAHGNHVETIKCMICQLVYSEKTVTTSPDCPECNNVHACNEARVEFGGEHGSHYKKTYCNICSKLQNTITVDTIDTCEVCLQQGSGEASQQYWYNKGYEAGKKAGEEIGFQKGYAKGAADKNYIGAGIQGFWNGLSDFYVILAEGVSVGGVTLGNVITSIIIILVVVFVIVLVVKK